MNAVTRIAVVGAGQAAAVAARALRRRGFDGAIEIIGAEAHRPYQRPPLSKEFLADGLGGDGSGSDGSGSDSADSDLFLLPADWCEANDVRLRLGQEATRVDSAAGAVELADRTRVPADAVLIATGGRPRRLTTSATSDARVHYLRTLDDALRLRERLLPGAHVIVAGAGFIGAEVAATARGRGAEVTVIEPREAPLLPLLGARVGTACAELHRANGTRLRLGVAVESVEETAAGVVVTAGGERTEGDVLVVGIGIVPNDEVAARSGIAVADGVITDEYCRTSVPNIFAAGDVARHFHPLFGERIRAEHFDSASRQAAVAAGAILGEARAYDDPYWFWSDQYDASLQYAGHAAGSDEIVIRGSLEDLDFCAFYLRRGMLRGAFGIDRGAEVTAARELIGQRRAVPPGALADTETDLAELASTAPQEPDIPQEATARGNIA
jgi:3-phenylpropionate/trans-cinnamate dioxygenase ferredoxin reductase component